MCSGNGVCSPCGKCQCRRKYSGRTCEKCQTCPSECDLRKRCVLCADGTDFQKADDCENCPFDYIVVDDLPECKPSLAILTIAGIVLGIIATIVAIGFLLLLLFKICLVIHDRREYAKFEKEAKNAKFGPEQNPLYKPASTVHENPRYRPSQFRPKAVPQLQED